VTQAQAATLIGWTQGGVIVLAIIASLLAGIFTTLLRKDGKWW
jgi:hypothetical protein